MWPQRAILGTEPISQPSHLWLAMHSIPFYQQVTAQQQGHNHEEQNKCKLHGREGHK
jgi:hypothetical protein